MSWSIKAQQILDRGVKAFRSMKLRPKDGDASVTEQPFGTGTTHFTCVVGALAYEAKQLSLLKDVQSGSSPEAWVARLFGCTDEEVRDIERGFDTYFNTPYLERNHFETTPGYDQAGDFWQIGWHVAKRATRDYMELDAAEEEAWQEYARLGLEGKDWIEVQMMRWSTRLSSETEAWLAECETEECEELRQRIQV